MKYVVSFNVLNPNGRPSAVQASVEVHDLARPAAVRAAHGHIQAQGIRIGSVPSSVRSAAPRRMVHRRPS